MGRRYGNYIGDKPSDRVPPKNPVQAFHDRVYGAESNYSDFAAHFKAEMFDPDDWARLFKQAGAKWAILTSKHHDGFELWPSPRASSNFPQFGNGWNSVELGPKRDLLGDFMTSLRQADLRAGFYHSLFECVRGWVMAGLWRSTPPVAGGTTRCTVAATLHPT